MVDDLTKVAKLSELDPFAVGSLVQGRYRIEGIVGRGGMSVVYVARHEALDRTVVLKVPTTTTTRERQRFLREARAAATIQHPNVCKVYDYGEHEGIAFLVMEYLEGRTLLDWMIEEDTLDEVDAVSFVRQILSALEAAHGHGFLHRDVKPANVILVGEPPKVKLLDFGLAKPLSPRPADPTLTATGVTVGTRPYMAPEQLSGRRDLDVRCDVYAAGAVLFHMLSGKLPFPGEGVELALAIASGSHLDLAELRPELPRGLVEAVHRALRLQRQDRFPTAKAFELALARVLPSPEDADTDVIGDAGMKALIAAAEAKPPRPRRPPPRPARKK